MTTPGAFLPYPDRRHDAFGESSANDGVDGAPNGISVPEWLSLKQHLKEKLWGERRRSGIIVAG
jgi:hypothetical protein